jgi:hypothetical protein
MTASPQARQAWGSAHPQNDGETPLHRGPTGRTLGDDRRYRTDAMDLSGRPSTVTTNSNALEYHRSDTNRGVLPLSAPRPPRFHRPGPAQLSGLRDLDGGAPAAYPAKTVNFPPSTRRNCLTPAGRRRVLENLLPVRGGRRRA